MIEKAFPKILAVDPTGCGCTECLIGEYVNQSEWETTATAADVAAVVKGEVANNTYLSTFDLIFSSYFPDDSATEFVRKMRTEVEDQFHNIDVDEIVTYGI